MLKRLLKPSPTAWVTTEKVFAQAFALLVFSVQAPLLGPHAFGAVALVMVIAGFWDAVPRTSLTDALISIRTIEPGHFTAATGVSTGLAVIFGILVAMFAEPISALLGDRTLAQIMRAMAVLPLIQSLSIAPTAAAQRELQLRSTTIRTVASLLAGGVVGLVLAIAGAGVWALIWQALVQAVVAALALWIAVPLRFGVAVSRRHLQDLATFGLPVVLARLMSWSEGQLPRLVLGVFLGPTELGLYGLGTRLNDIVVQIAIWPKTIVARISLRQFAGNREGLAAAVRQICGLMSIMTFPVCVGGAAIMPALFHAWLDPRWLDAIVSSQILLLMAMPSVTYYLAAAVLLAVNQQKWEAGISALQTLSILIVMAVFAQFGLVAVTLAIALRSLAMLPVAVLVMRRQCGLRLADTLLPQVPALIAAGLMGLAILALGDQLGSLSSARAMAIEIAAGVVIYPILLGVILPRRVLQLVKAIIDPLERRFIANLEARKILRPLGLEWLLFYRRHRRVVKSDRRYRGDGQVAEMLAQLREKNLVFTVTAGRTGTTFAQKLFAPLPQVLSEHEPKPSLHGYLRQIERHPERAQHYLLKLKLPAIAALGTPRYIELSHVMCKGYLEPLLELGITPNLLVLRRAPRLVALSYLERFTVPEVTFLGLEWLISPRFGGGRLPLPQWRRMSDYQLTFWYALEIERRQRDYAQMIGARGGRVAVARMEDLRQFGHFLNVAEALQLVDAAVDRTELAAGHRATSGVIWNRNEGPKWRYCGDIEREEEEVWATVSVADPGLRAWVEPYYLNIPEVFPVPTA